MHNEELSAKERDAARRVYNDLVGKRDTIDVFGLGDNNRLYTVDKDSYSKNINRLASTAIGKYFEGSTDIVLRILEDTDPANPKETIQILEYILNNGGKIKDPVTGADMTREKVTLKDGVTKEDVQNYINNALANLAGERVESSQSSQSSQSSAIRPPSY
jgi:hypothetical protein